jgi:hypothetical protein
MQKLMLTRVLNLTPWAGLAAICLLAFWLGLHRTSQLNSPYDADAFRDVGIAQSFLDGTYPADNCYLDATQWYSPLAGGVIATVSKVTGATPLVVDARLGAYANLLVPITFFLLSSALFGRWVALAAVSFMVFAVPGHRFTQANPTYSPWLFSSHLSQALFYLSMLLYLKACRSERRLWYAIAGVGLGVTFIGHTGPAVLFGSIVLAATLGKTVAACRGGIAFERIRWPIGQFLLVMSVAFLVSLPYSRFVLFRYGYHMVNSYPPRWISPELELRNIEYFISGFLSIATAVAYLGLAGLIFAPREKTEKALVLCWLGLAAVFLTYSYVVQALSKSGIEMPMIVPGYHYLLYLLSAEVLLVGYGVVVLARIVVDGLRWLVHAVTRRRYWVTTARAATTEQVVTLLLVLALCAAFYPQYRSLFEHKDDAWYKDYAPANSWILENASPQDVFLCDDAVGLLVVAPANRKLVSTDRYYSNPYLDWKMRDDDRVAMLQALVSKDENRFRSLASKYQVTYCIIHQPKGLPVKSALGHGFELRLHTGPLAIYRVQL